MSVGTYVSKLPLYILYGPFHLIDFILKVIAIFFFISLVKKSGFKIIFCGKSFLFYFRVISGMKKNYTGTYLKKGFVIFSIYKVS
jgi:hypothetical protein